MECKVSVERWMLAVALVALSLVSTDPAHAQDVCNVTNSANPPENATSPGSATIIGDMVTYSFDIMAGGIDPGETRAVSVSVRGVPKHVAQKDLVVEVSILDVADAQKRLVVGDVTVIGWSREPSEKTCG